MSDWHIEESVVTLLGLIWQVWFLDLFNLTFMQTIIFECLKTIWECLYE